MLTKQRQIQLEHMAVLLDTGYENNVYGASRAVSGTLNLGSDVLDFFRDEAGNVGYELFEKSDRVMMVLFYLEANR